VLGLLEPTQDWRQVALELGFALLVVGIAMLYVARVDPLLAERPRRQLLLVVTLLIVGVSARILLPGQNLSPYLFPGAAAAMLIVLFMNIQYATLIAFAVSLAVGFSAGGSLQLVLYMLLGGLVGSLALMRTEQLSAFVPATGYLALVNIATLLTIHVNIGTRDIRGFLELAGIGLLNAVFSTSLCFVAYTFTGRLFGITTSIQLMELARPTHPLFRQLLIKAPGTYHHSILISNMAERAAEAIGADILLTRVGSYYHDIGKTLRPHFYAENQSEGENPLDKLDPETAAEIIISHAAEGLELARRYRLPDKVRAFIPEHHGTTLVAYFYRRATQEAGDQDVDEAAFRYPGPKPQSRETAILMLADAVEAWVRADRPATEPELDRVIRQVINDRLISGQLDETDLTLRDLDSIRQAFGDVLKGLYHPRIQYPERTSRRPERVANG
jgi:cyclic-di-AMP phosphodiesterase PgpH